MITFWFHPVDPPQDWWWWLGGGVPAGLVSVAKATRAIISKRAEATFLHTSAGPLSLVERLHLTCMLNTDVGEQIGVLVLLQRPRPTSKKPSDRWLRLHVGHACCSSPLAWHDAAAANCELHSLNRRHPEDVRCRTASGSRGTSRAINNMDRIRLCGDPRAAIRWLWYGNPIPAFSPPHALKFQKEIQSFGNIEMPWNNIWPPSSSFTLDSSNTVLCVFSFLLSFGFKSKSFANIKAGKKNEIKRHSRLDCTLAASAWNVHLKSRPLTLEKAEEHKWTL